MAKISNKMKIKNADGTFEDIQISYIGQNGTTAEGIGTVATAKGQHVQGKYNIEDIEKKYAHIVGNGEENIPSNAHTLDWEGNAWFAGEIKAGETEIVKCYPEVNITWDGNTEDLISIGNYYKVSDYIPTYEQILSISKISYMDYDTDTAVLYEDSYDAKLTDALGSSTYKCYYFTASVPSSSSRIVVRIYPENGSSGQSPGIYFYKSSTNDSRVTSITFDESTELNLSKANDKAGIYGGRANSTGTVGYNIPTVAVDENGRVISISNSLLGPVMSKSPNELGLVSYNQLFALNCSSGSMYWMGAENFVYVSMGSGKVKYDTVSYSDSTVGGMVSTYIPRIFDVKVYVYTSENATTRSWISVPFSTNTGNDGMGSTLYTNVSIKIPSEYYAYCEGKNIDGTPIPDGSGTDAYVLYWILYEPEKGSTSTI